MKLQITRTSMWATELKDEPSGVATILQPLADAGANLEFVLARRQPDKPGTGVVFVTPLNGKKVQSAAIGVGFVETRQIVTLKVEGRDRPGLGAMVTRAVGDAGVNLRGLSTTVVGSKFVCYLACDSTRDAKKAAKALAACRG